MQRIIKDSKGELLPAIKTTVMTQYGLEGNLNHETLLTLSELLVWITAVKNLMLSTWGITMQPSIILVVPENKQRE